MLVVLSFKVHLVIVEVLPLSAYILFPPLSTPYFNVQLNHSTSNSCLELRRLQVWCCGRSYAGVEEAPAVTSCVSEWVLGEASIYTHRMSDYCCLVMGLGWLFFLRSVNFTDNCEVVSDLSNTACMKMFWLRTTQYMWFQLD